MSVEWMAENLVVRKVVHWVVVRAVTLVVLSVVLLVLNLVAVWAVMSVGQRVANLVV